MSTSHLRVAIYARVSSEQQAKEDTIASQLEAIARRIADDGLACDPELHFVDDGYSGSTLVRPGLERLRDQATASAHKIPLFLRRKPTFWPREASFFRSFLAETP
jgi:Resolvase, N terminal domain